MSPARLASGLALALAFSAIACTTTTIVKKAPGEQGTGEEGTSGEEASSGGGAKDWSGQSVVVESEGVDALAGEGGVVIVAAPGAKRVTASVEPDAPAANAKPNTQPSPSMTIDESGSQVKVSCVRATDNGLGCKKLTVTVPAGTPETPLALNITSGNGGVRVDGALTVSALTVVEKGTGAISLRAHVVAGATVDASGADSVELSLPSDFAADQVDLSVGGDDVKRIDTAAFPGMQSGQPFGEPGQGAKLLRARSSGTGASSVVRVKQL
jgi:hypothetical protein